MAYADLKRRLYAGNRPGRLASLLNRAWSWIHAAGLLPDYLVTLELPGRRTGRTLSLPLVMAVVEGERYLVSMLGEDAGWVKNLRAAEGRAVLRHGRSERVRLEDVPVERRAPILRAYLKRAPGARPHVPVHKDAPLAEFEGVAARIPVFRVVPDR